MTTPLHERKNTAYSPDMKCIVGGLLVLALGCHREWRASFHGVQQHRDVARDAPFLKVHTVEGEVYVLERWEIDTAAGVVRGEGLHYDIDRLHPSIPDRFEVPLDRVALFETNRPDDIVHAGPPVLGLVSAVSLGVTVYCAENPKACFGSCPTFYVGDEVFAEGFSAAVARPLEETDVDAARAVTLRGADRVEIEMRNEALETHYVDRVRLLLVPRSRGRRVVRVGAAFHEVLVERAPEACVEDGADCLDAVAHEDGAEHQLRADAHDLAAPSALVARLPAAEGSAARGVLVSGRHSLIGTFVFYQLLAWMGRSEGAWIAAYERGAAPEVERAMRFGRELGVIRIDARSEGGAWQEIGRYDEVGPIARDAAVVPIPAALGRGPIEVRLRTARGWWRVERLAAVELGEAREALALEPAAVRRSDDGWEDPRVLGLLRAEGDRLTTLPGDRWTLVFDVPPGDHEVFLESRGYYHEWMREGWLREEDPLALARFFLDPRSTMRRLAPAYRRIEDRIDAAFWSSRFGARRRRSTEEGAR